MADYFTQFSCLLDVGAPENAARALEIYEADCADGALEAQFSNGFFVSVPSEDAGSQLWIRDEGAGDPELVIRFVKICAAEFGLSGCWGFQYSNICSKPRLRWLWRRRACARPRHWRNNRLGSTPKTGLLRRSPTREAES